MNPPPSGGGGVSSGSTGVVVERDGMKQVFIGGTWIGQFEIAGT
jgi:hypothetical protein